jgi:hypothetical protein
MRGRIATASVPQDAIAGANRTLRNAENMPHCNINLSNRQMADRAITRRVGTRAPVAANIPRAAEQVATLSCLRSH